MPIRILSITFVLAFAPALASAECPWDHKSTSTCAEGQVLDADKGVCVDQATS